MRNRHHVLFPKVLHEATTVGRSLREMNLLIPRMDEDAHTDLHKNIMMVPPLPNGIGSRVLKMMRESDAENNFQAIDDYIIAVDRSINHYRSNDLDKKLGELVIECMERQIPYIEIGQKVNYYDLSTKKVSNF